MNYYQGEEHLRSSWLGALLQSAAHCRQLLDNPPAPSAALTFGRALHAACLEPDVYIAQFAAFSGDRRTTAGKAAYAALLETGAEIISEDDAAAIAAMRAAVAPHLPDGAREFAYAWTDAHSGALCKAKADILGEYVYDLKSTDKSAADFAYTVRKYSYHRQAAFYLDGARAAGHSVRGFRWIVVEKSAPFGVRIYEAGDETLQRGREEYQRAAVTWQMAKITGDWPGYETQHVEII
jgi:exodeoxyribonuclease VIII